MFSTIGRDIKTQTLLQIGDIERRSGLYVLGKPGMGKTALLTNLILEDIAHGHGVFFLDPHGDAILDIINRLPGSRNITDVILLDPTHPTHTFGINPLRCSDITHIRQINSTYARAYGIFERIWRDDFGPWLQLILSNTLSVFVENQGYTLADVPLFFDDEDFRNFLVGNVRHNTTAANYWRRTFAKQRERDQQAKMDAALTRLYILLTKDYVRGVVAQPETTLDFGSLMRDNKVLLLNLPAHLAEDDKRFLGTIVISELLHAVRERAEIAQDQRSQFCVFVDEFQNFATSRDFGAPITEGRKFGIATTIAHQERLGQFSDDKKIQGATAAVANKVIFQITSSDAAELAPEFADAPPSETKREPQLVISQEPVADLMRGHTDPEMRAFVDGYLRILQERRVHTKEELELQRMIGQDYRDEAALYQIYGRMESAHDRAFLSYSNVREMLTKADQALLSAKGQTAKALYLLELELGKGLRLAIEDINRFLTQVMEGKTAPGQEAFSSFLFNRIHDSPRVSQDEAWLIELYIAVSYGDSQTPRAIPASLAAKCGLWLQEAAREQLSAQHTLDRFVHHSTMYQKMGLPASENREAALEYIAGWRKWDAGDSIESVRHDDYVRGYLLIHQYPAVRELLTPFFSSRFAKTWEGVFLRDQTSFHYTPEGAEYSESLKGDHIDQIIYAIFYWWKFWRQMKSLEYVAEKEFFMNSLASFLRKHGEGAVVTFTILNLGRGFLSPAHASVAYPFIHVLDLPAVEGYEPLQIFCLGKRLNDLLVGYNHRFKEEFSAYFEHEPGEIGRQTFDERKARNFDVHVDTLRATDLLNYRGSSGSGKHTRLDADLVLSALTKTPWKCPQAMLSVWSKLDEITRVYLVLRACDIVMFGEEVADYTYPQPTIEGCAKAEISALVAALVTFRRLVEVEDGKTIKSETLSRDLVAFNEGNIGGYQLTARILAENEITRLRNECSEKLKDSSVRAVIDQW